MVVGFSFGLRIVILYMYDEQDMDMDMYGLVDRETDYDGMTELRFTHGLLRCPIPACICKVLPNAVSLAFPDPRDVSLFVSLVLIIAD